MMTIAEWIALGGVILLLAGAVWKQGSDAGEIKAGVRELLGRVERTDKSIDRVESRVDTLQTRMNDHTERIARIEGRTRQ
jgi:peptidoglycan hydrolase CwlO-like protein